MLEQLKIFIEDDDGSSFLRIQENRINRDYDTVVSDYQRHDKPGDTSYYSRVNSTDSVLYKNFDISNTKVGIGIYGKGDVAIYNYEFVENNSIRTKEDGTLSDNKFSSAVRLSAGSDIFDIEAPITIQRVYADGKNNPMKVDGLDYRSTNKDFITNDNRATDGDPVEIFIRDFTAKNMSDAIIDNKGIVYIMNGTLSNAHRILRSWPDAEIIIVNSVIETGDGQDLMWFKDETASIKYFNCLWNGKSQPDHDLIGIEKRPAGMSKEQFIEKTLVELDHNVLEKISPFFATYNADYSVEVSVNGGDWQNVDLDPTFFTENGIIGDPKIELPDMGNGDYEVRVTGTLSDGEKIKDVTNYTIDDADYDYVAPAQTAVVQDPEPVIEPTSDTVPLIDSILATEDDLKLSGSSDDDVLKGASGNDIIRGSGGNDTLSGESGDDDINGGSGKDVISGGAGDDKIVGASGDDTLDGGAGNDRLIGEGGKDIIKGGDGDDDLRGADDNDRLFGDAGNDALRGGAGTDWLAGNNGNDMLDGGTGEDLLYGGWGDDELFGGKDADKLDGGPGNDKLFGGVGKDALIGGDGDDLLNGGRDADFLTGGRGADTFIFESAYRSNHDVISDFSVSDGDRIDISELITAGSVKESNFDKFVRIDKTAYGQFDISINDNGSGREFIRVASVDAVDTATAILGETASDWLDHFEF